MKYSITLIYISILTSYYSQDTISLKNKNVISSIDVIYGNYLLIDNFNKQFNTYTDYSFSNPLQSIGISLGGLVHVNRRNVFPAHLSYSQIIPQNIILNDSVNGKINGFTVGYSLYGLNLFPKSRTANCILTFGFNTGRLRVSDTEYKQSKNPFFSPSISLQPKLKLGKIVVSIRGDLSYDISKSSWRSLNITNKISSINLNPLKQTGGSIYLSLGWITN